MSCTALLSAAVLAGCANSSGEQDASRVARQFFEAAGRGNGQTACALLAQKTQDDLQTSDGQPCTESLPMDRLHGTVREASVWSNWAQVSTEDGAVFLTEFDSRWLITAVGCRPNGDAPYHCVVGG